MSNPPPNNIVFRIGAFSTNPPTHSPISLLESYFQSSSNKNYSEVKEDHIDYDHTTLSHKTIRINFIQIISLDKVNRICNCADCFIIFIDLTSSKSKENLNEIFNYLDWHCSLDNKIYVIGIYTQPEEIKDDMLESNIKETFAAQEKLKTEYFQIALQDTTQMETVMNNLTNEASKVKLSKMKDRDDNNLIQDMSKSMCEII